MNGSLFLMRPVGNWFHMKGAFFFRKKLFSDWKAALQEEAVYVSYRKKKVFDKRLFYIIKKTMIMPLETESCKQKKSKNLNWQIYRKFCLYSQFP